MLKISLSRTANGKEYTLEINQYNLEGVKNTQAVVKINGDVFFVSNVKKHHLDEDNLLAAVSAALIKVKSDFKIVKNRADLLEILKLRDSITIMAGSIVVSNQVSKIFN
ncbi:hypothetical protein [Tenacibaculum phage Larrie]|nr:hypothetical protein [Tenacibaculum phage Larrie]